MTCPPELLKRYIDLEKPCELINDNILKFPVTCRSLAMEANRYYFGHPEWGQLYLEACHRSKPLQDRWQAALGSWQDKVVVDIGCGAGNLGAALLEHCGQPQILIGVDISEGALEMAQQIGYAAVLADAHQLPFIDGFADVVVLNAALHHCDDMTQVLQEAARLVKPGGWLITDHDPQRTAWQDNLLAQAIWNVRLPIYRLIKRGGHTTGEEQYWSTHSETHHHPGDGVTAEFFCEHLQPLGFKLTCYPHNGGGAEVLQGDHGRPELKSRLVQWLTGIDPDQPEAALLLMCVARRDDNPA